MIAVTDLAKAYGGTTLFAGASFQLNAGNRYGLVGANGSGKTTLLRILAGDEEASEGTVSTPRRMRLGVLRQDRYLADELPILDVVMRGNERLWRAMRDKDDLLARADDHFDGDRYAELEDVILSLDGYSYEARCAEILEGLGIPTARHSEPLSALSGGFKLRVLLAQVLASEPHALLLDEPTNHLDILSIRWLEKFLGSYDGCAVVISHDHRFLDNVCSHILDIDYETVTLYTGNYSRFVRAKEAERERREAEIAKREKEIADHQAFVERFRAKASKARQAQSKMKQMERIVISELPRSSRRHPAFHFVQRRPSGKDVLHLEGISKSFGDTRVLSNVDLHLRRGDRLAVIGPNGIGKSTLLKIATGRLQADHGTVEWGYATHTAYFAQDHRELLAERSATVEGWLGEACPGRDIGWVRGQLGKVLFSGDEVTKSVDQLSGGEAARLIFARIAVEQPNVMVLDEPTNHLDLEAIEALVDALGEYDGTLVFVSHDRWFVSRLATRILELGITGVTDYRGSYADYVATCGDDHLDVDVAAARARRDRQRGADREGARRRPGPDDRERQRRARDLQLRRDVVTAGLEAAESRLAEITETFADPGFYQRSSDQSVRSLEAEHQRLRGEIDELMAEWERLEHEIEALHQADATA